MYKAEYLQYKIDDCINNAIQYKNDVCLCNFWYNASLGFKQRLELLTLEEACKEL